MVSTPLSSSAQVSCSPQLPLATVAATAAVQQHSKTIASAKAAIHFHVVFMLVCLSESVLYLSVVR